MTDDSPKFRSLAQRFLDEPVNQPMWVDPSKLMVSSVIAGTNWSLRRAG